MSSHKTDVMNYLIASTRDTSGDRERKVAIAQVHATLHAAEQQRIANLIAYKDNINTFQRNGYALDAETQGWLDNASEQIIEGLGL